MQVTGLSQHLEEVVGVVKVLWKLPLVGVQVTGLVTTPGGSWDGDQVL